MEEAHGGAPKTRCRISGKGNPPQKCKQFTHHNGTCPAEHMHISFNNLAHLVMTRVDTRIWLKNHCVYCLRVETKREVSQSQRHTSDLFRARDSCTHEAALSPITQATPSSSLMTRAHSTIGCAFGSIADRASPTRYLFGLVD